MIITIDGPTASGKSTVGRLLAKNLGFYYVNSGLLFRAVAYVLHKEYGYTQEQFEHPKREDLDAVMDFTRLFYRYDGQGREHIFFDDQDITPFLKEGYIDQLASIISLNTDVREKLVQWQRKIGQMTDIVVDGRDAGSVVFPNADYKFYITASEEERARRWQRQQEEKYRKKVSLAQALSDVKGRDQRDMTRAHAPLVIPAGAHVIDNTSLTIQQTLDVLLNIIRGS